MKKFLILLTTLHCAIALAGPGRPIQSSTFSVQAPCGPDHDPVALQGQWFLDIGTGATNVNTREYHDEDNALAIAGVVQNIQFSDPTNSYSNITGFDILVTVSNTLPSDYGYGSASNSHSEVQNSAAVTDGGSTMNDVRITAEFAVPNAGVIPNGTPPYWPDPLSAGLYHIVAANADEHAWYCWSPDQPQPYQPAGAYQVPAWNLTPSTLPPGGTATATMQFTVTGSGIPYNGTDYRHGVLRYSQDTGADVLYNRYPSLKISHWLDTLVIDNGITQNTPPPPYWLEEEVEYIHASDASVFFNDEESEESHKMHYPQMPDPNGWDVRAGFSWDEKQKVLADDFQCSASGPITNITFWGSFRWDEYLTEHPFHGVTGFHVSFHKDIPDPDGEGPLFSKPAIPAEWEKDILTLEPPPGWNITVTPEEPSEQGWFDPNNPENTEYPNHWQYFRYDITVPESDAFVQTEGEIYWLDISAMTQGPEWGWKTTTNHWNDDAVWADLPVDSTNQWNELIDPLTGESLDLAFLIDGPEEEEPDEEYDWGDAPDSPYPTLAASSGASHVISSSIYLGAAVDSEPDGQPTANADGDDLNGATPDDEDGVVFSTPFYPGTVAQIDVTAVGSGLLNGWIDFNADGDWSDSGEQVFTDLPLSTGTSTLNILVPATATPATNTFMRLRYSTVSGLPPTGSAADGEVEDYPIDIQVEAEVDWGDLPQPGYPVTATNNGAHHIVTPPLFLGGFCDGETDGQPSINADGDEKNLLYPGIPYPPGDEDGVILKSVIMAGGYASVDVIAAQPGVLDAWLDFNVDSSFAQPGDRIFSGRALSAGTNSLQFAVPLTATTNSGPLHARFRFTSGSSAYPGGTAVPTGLAFDGEVEDYHWLISAVDSGSDFGDAPDGPYPTLLSSTGPSHTISVGVMLGAGVDAEIDGQPSLPADGDDTTGMADEDGIAFAGKVISGSTASLDVIAGVSGGRLDAWIDFNADGIWAHPGEHLWGGTSQALSPGANSLTFAAPLQPTLQPGPSFARFRVSTAGGLSPTGAAPDGEVEDYSIDLYQPAPTNMVLTNIVVSISNDVAKVEWSAESNISYQVLSSTNLLNSNGWVNIGTTLLSPINWQTNSASPTSQFYRVIAPWTP